MKDKIGRLVRSLKGMQRVLVAYSGGVDSTFLVAMARKTLGRENLLAVTAASETYPAAEMRQAKAMAKRLDIRHALITTAELRNPAFKSNPVNRCFYCKDELFGKLSAMAVKEAMALCDATNYSDRKDFRPGRRAAEKWSVVSPLLEARLTKSEIRDCSRRLKLPTWNMPAQACIASRFPYGTPLTEEALKKVEKGEAFLRRFSLGTFRLRHHGDIARLEIDADAFKILINSRKYTIIVHYLKKLGWRYVTIDLEGYRTGSMNPQTAG